MIHMGDNNPFAEMNPFLRLNTKRLPRRESSHAAPEEDTQQEQAGENTQDEDARLFLQAVRALPLQTKS